MSVAVPAPTPSTGQQILAAAKTAAVGQVSSLIASSKASFLETFGSFFSVADLKSVEMLFTRAAIAKAGEFAAATPEEAQEYADEYDAYLDEMETIGDQYLIVGKSKAGALVRPLAHQAIAGIFAVMGAVLQAGLGIVVPGIGSLVGAGLNAGLQHVVSHFLGD